MLREVPLRPGLEGAPRAVDRLDRRALHGERAPRFRRRAGGDDALVVPVTARRTEHAERGEHRRERERHDVGESSPSVTSASPSGPAPPYIIKRVVVDVVAAPAEHVHEKFAHVVADQAMRALGELVDARLELLRHRLEGLNGGVEVERHVAAEEVAGVQVAEEDVAVGDRRNRPAQAPADVGAGASRPDRQLAGERMNAELRAHPGADRFGVDHRDVRPEAEQPRLPNDRDHAVADDPDVEARAADVAADDVARAHELADVMAAEHAADGAGGIRFVEPRGADRHGAAVGEEGRHLAVEALGARPRLDPLEVAPRRLARVCLRDDAGESGVFLVGRRDRRGEDDRNLLVDLADRFRCRLLVRRVHVGEEEHHGDHLGALVEEPLRLRRATSFGSSGMTSAPNMSSRSCTPMMRLRGIVGSLCWCVTVWRRSAYG